MLKEHYSTKSFRTESFLNNRILLREIEDFKKIGNVPFPIDHEIRGILSVKDH